MTSAPLVVSRLPVGSSARSRAGSVTSARAMATRCCWPPDSSVGSWSSRSPSPRRSSEALARAGPVAAADALVGQGRGHVVEGARPGQQVVRLEDEPDRAAADRGQPVVVEILDRRPVEDVAPGRGPVEAADDVHQGRLARPRRADNGEELAAFDDEVEAVERPDVDPSRLVDPTHALEPDERIDHGAVPPPLPPRFVPPLPPPRWKPPPAPGRPRPPPVPVVVVWAAVVPITTVSPAWRPLLISACVEVTRPTVTSRDWAVPS